MAWYYEPMTLNESLNNFNGGCNTTLDCPQRQECWPYPSPQDGNMGQCQCFYVFNLDGPTCQTTSAKNWGMWFFYLLITVAHRGAAIYVLFSSLLRLKKLDGWFPVTAQLTMLWMLFAESTLGLLNEFIQSFDFLGVILYDGQQEFSWVSNFQQSIEAFERFFFYYGDGRTAMCNEWNRAYLSSFEYYNFDHNPMVEPGTNVTRLSRQGRLAAQSSSWIALLLLDNIKLMVLETLHYLPLLYANLNYLNIVRASNSLKKATKGLGCFKYTVAYAMLVRLISVSAALAAQYYGLTVKGMRHDRIASYEYPWYAIMVQHLGDQVGLSSVVIGWGMLVSMMIPKEKRSKALNVLVKSLVGVTTFFIVYIILCMYAITERGMGGWSAELSEKQWGVDFRIVCPLIVGTSLWIAYTCYYTWVFGSNAVVAWFYRRQLKKETADMTPAQQESKNKKGNFLMLILFVFTVDLAFSHWYAGFSAHILWDNPVSLNSKTMPFHFALTGGAYHSHQDAQSGECFAFPHGWYHYHLSTGEEIRTPVKVINSTISKYHITYSAAHCFSLTDAPWPGMQPPVSTFNRDTSFFGTWCLILGNRIMHTVHAIIVVLPVFLSARRRYNGLKKVKPNKKITAN